MSVSLPRPTSLGVKALLFYLLLLAAFLATPYSNLFFLLIVFLSALAVLGLFWTYRNVAGLSGRVARADPAPSGRGVELSAVIAGDRRPRLGLRLELDVEGEGKVEFPCAVAQGETSIEARLPGWKRGLYPIRSARLLSSWPVGLFTASVPIEAPARLVVYPAPAGVAETGGQGPGLEELCGWAGSRDGLLQPSELREYRHGDDLRRVHWKASARRSTLVIKEWEGATGQGREVVLDRRAEEEPFEEALSIVSALAFASRELKEPLTLHTQGLSATFGSTGRPWPELYVLLAGAETLSRDAPAPPPSPPEVLRLPLKPGGVR